jgi:hypothetical protein
MQIIACMEKDDDTAEHPDTVDLAMIVEFLQLGLEKERMQIIPVFRHLNCCEQCRAEVFELLDLLHYTYDKQVQTCSGCP